MTERWRIAFAWLVSCLFLAVFFKLVMAQTDTTPPSTPTNVQVTRAHLQVTGLTGDQVLVEWTTGDCVKVTMARTLISTLHTLTVTCVH